MPEIAGYADTISVKGQYYRLASSPKPVVYTGDISTISDDLLSKAMFVTRNATNTASLPNSFGTNFLITTVEYGSGNYLQTAYLVQTGYECYEYRRIYSSGSWTSWIGVDSAIATASSAATSAKETADKAATDAGTAISNAASLKTTVDSLGNTVTTNIASLNDRVGTVETKTTPINISNSYVLTKTSGNSKWNSAEAYATKIGNIVNIQIEFGFPKGNTFAEGSSPWVGTISGGPLPLYSVRALAYYTDSIVACTITPEGVVQTRILASSLQAGGSGRDYVRPTGIFVING